MRKLLISLLFIFILILVLNGCEQKVECKKPYIKVGTSCCLDEDENSICDKDEIKAEEKGMQDVTGNVITDVEETTHEEEQGEAKEAKSDFESYDLEKLSRDINSISKKHYTFRQDKDDPQYYNGNGQKFYVINMFDKNQVYDSKSFYDRFSAKNWKGYLHFVNATEMGMLHPPLTEENFSNEQDYKEYVRERALVEQTFVENTIDLEEGKVLEYQLLNWIYDVNENFEGAWQDTLLIYEIYCSPKLIVFIRPDWTKLGIDPGSKPSDVRANWDSSISELRRDMLDTANKILKTCPVNKDFFKDIPNEKFESSETLAYYWKTDYQFYWNLTTNISPEIEPQRDGKYLLKRINISFTNYEPYIMWGDLLLNINTISDGKEDYEFKSEKRLGEKISGGETIQRDLGADNTEDKKPIFSNNLTINFELVKYGDGFTIKSGSITIDNKGNVINK